MSYKPTLCLDFDGVIHSYERGWQDGLLYGTVTDGFFEFILEARKGFNIVIHTSRLNHIQEEDELRSWLSTHLVYWKLLNNISPDFPPYINDFSFAARKPPANVTIDDRALTFTGNWNDFPLEKLLNFKPWNAK